MVDLRILYLSDDTDRHGNVRYYVRVPGRRKVRIRAPLNEDGSPTEAFMEAYWAAIRGENRAARTRRTPVDETSFQFLVERYFTSPLFEGFDPATQADKKSVLNRFCKTAGTISFKHFRKEDIEKSQAKRRATPSAANKLVKCLRALFKWAIDAKYMTANPAAGVSMLATGSTGFHTWTMAEVSAYRAHHPVGSLARLALELMLATGARRSDAVRLGRQHEANGWLSWIQHKGRKKPKRIEVPILPELREALDATKTGDLTYLVTSHGRPFTSNGFGNKMREWCDAAGLPQCSSHGLRKASAVVLAEHGATAMELCAIFGWSKLETAEIYVRQARKRTLVGNAFGRLTDRSSADIVPLSSRRSAGGTKSGEKRGKSKVQKGDGGPGRPTTSK